MVFVGINGKYCPDSVDTSNSHNRLKYLELQIFRKNPALNPQKTHTVQDYNISQQKISVAKYFHPDDNISQHKISVAKYFHPDDNISQQKISVAKYFHPGREKHVILKFNPYLLSHTGMQIVTDYILNINE